MSEVLTVGREDGDYVRIEVLGRAHPNATLYDDANWLTSRVAVHTGGFTAKTDACLRSAEFFSFAKELERLSVSLEGTADFKSLEKWLQVHIEGDRLGHLAAKGFLIDSHISGNKLSFRIEFDQTDLPRIMRELKAILMAFPIPARRGFFRI